MDVGVHSTGIWRCDTDNAIAVTSIQSARRRAGEPGRTDLAIVAECHRLNPHQESVYQTFLADALAVSPSLCVIMSPGLFVQMATRKASTHCSATGPA